MRSIHPITNFVSPTPLSAPERMTSAAPTRLPDERLRAQREARHRREEEVVHRKAGVRDGERLAAHLPRHEDEDREGQHVEDFVAASRDAEAQQPPDERADGRTRKHAEGDVAAENDGKQETLRGQRDNRRERQTKKSRARRKNCAKGNHPFSQPFANSALTSRRHGTDNRMPTPSRSSATSNSCTAISSGISPPNA